MRGSTLATTLILAALALTLAFTLASVSLTHLGVGSRLDNTQHARNLAEAVVSKAIERLFVTDGNVSVTNETFEATFPSSPPGAVGLLTFQNATAANLSIARSTFNLRKDSGIRGSGDRVVPREAVHLIGEGRCNGVTRRVEAVLHIPAFRYALSSEQALRVNGPSVVASVNSTADLQMPLEDHLDTLLPAHVSSNLFGNLDGNITVTGTVRAQGGINTTGRPEPKIQGGLLPNNGRLPLPDLKPADFDPARLGKTHLLGNVTNGRFRASGLVRDQGDFVADKLVLPDGSEGKGAIVFIDGNLCVNSIVGVGAVITTGNLSIQQADDTNVTSDNMMALLSGNRLEVTGVGRSSAFIKGIAYSRGSLTVRDATFRGAVLMNGPNAADSLNVEAANLIQQNDLLGFEFDMPFGIGDGRAGINTELANGVNLTTFYDASRDGYTDGNGNPYRAPKFEDLKFTQNQADLTLGEAITGFLTNMLNGSYRPPEGASWAEYLAARPGLYPSGALDRDTVRTFLEHDPLGPGGHGVNVMRQSLADIQAFYDKFQRQPRGKGKIVFDPNRFMPLSDSGRIILWKDL